MPIVPAALAPPDATQRANLAPRPPRLYAQVMNRRVLRRWSQAATAIAAGVILWATLTPSPPSAHGLPDWAIHFVLFTGIGAPVALWFATSDRARRSPQRTLVGVMLALWLFGGLTELAQGATTTRSPSITDLAFDVAGALTGFLAGGAAWRVLLGRVAR